MIEIFYVYNVIEIFGVYCVIEIFDVYCVFEIFGVYYVFQIFGFYYVFEIHIWLPINQNIAHREAIRLVLTSGDKKYKKKKE